MSASKPQIQQRPLPRVSTGHAADVGKQGELAGLVRVTGFAAVAPWTLHSPPLNLNAVVTGRSVSTRRHGSIDADTLTALAQATTRLRLGTLVTGIHYRHPAVLANMAAAVDIISNGRLELGIGAGWNEDESGAYGIELGSIKERFDRFEEACQVLTSLLSQETTDFDGRYYQLKGARNEPKGPQRPHPPICIGGSGEKRTLRLTARYAQHWNFIGGPPEEFARKRDVLAAHCADIGRDPKEIMRSAHLALGPDRDYGQVIDSAAALGAEGLDLGIVYITPPHDPAVLEPLAEAIRESGLLTA